VEARGLCQAGLRLDPDNKDLRDLKKVGTVRDAGLGRRSRAGRGGGAGAGSAA